MARDTFVLCRRDLAGLGAVRYCARPIKTPNPSNWCDDCRSRLPLWPASKEVAADSPEAAALIAACQAVDMTGALEEIAAKKREQQPPAFPVVGGDLALFGPGAA